jgi:iron complex outermembrane receptor protein
MLRKLSLCCLVSIASSMGAGGALADENQTAATTVDQTTGALAEVTVTAAKVRSLDVRTPTASRLGLTVRDTPATVDTIDSDEMLGRGLESVEMVIDEMPGVVSGGSPGDPAELSMRGFTGNQITVLHNGIYVGPSNFVNRPGNSFNLASVEILKGPASVLYGQGAIGGVVNMVNKKPGWNGSEGSYLASVGSYGSTDVGIDYTTQLGDKVAVRGDVSRTGSDGYVHNARTDSLNGTAALEWRPNDSLDVELLLDYLNDDPSNYYGTPFVPSAFAARPLTGVIDSAASGGLAIDERMRYVNYNVADSRLHSNQIWPQLQVRWTPNDHLTLENNFYYFHASREWWNSETYTFDPATDLIDRDRFTVLHNQTMIGDQGSATVKSVLLGLTNTLVVGFDYSHLRFIRPSSAIGGDSVDPFNPSPGLYGAISFSTRKTYWNDFAGFMEDALDLTKSVKLITGFRYDDLAVTRQNFNSAGTYVAGTSFSPTYRPATWRVGLVYSLSKYLTPYVSWTTGQDPPGSALFTVNASQNFGLSRSYQGEAGVKGNTTQGRMDYTLSVYDIKRSNIFLDGGQNVVIPIGYELSRGLELTTDFRPTAHWTISANTAYTDAYLRPSPGLATAYQPPNVPRWTANVWTSINRVGGIPLDFGAGVRFIGSREAGLPNDVKLDPYKVVDLYVSYEVSPGTLITGRVNNALDKAYANWADIFYPSEVMLGPPRTFEVSIVGRF